MEQFVNDQNANDEIVNIYEGIEPSEDVEIDFRSGFDTMNISHKLRESYDEFVDCWESVNITQCTNIKKAFESAAKKVSEERFLSVKWLSSGGASESSSFETVMGANETLLRESLFGYSCQGNAHNEKLVAEYMTSNSKFYGLRANDIDIMLVTDNITIPNNDCLKQTETPGFYKVQIDENMSCFGLWSECCVAQDNAFYLSQTLIKERLRKIFHQLEREGPFIVIEGELAFTVAVLETNNVRFYDIVFAIPCSFWPNSAKKWIERERKWPSKESILKIINGGVYTLCQNLI